MNLLSLKSKLLAHLHQLVIMDLHGLILESCDGILDLSQDLGKPIWEALPIFEGLQEEILHLHRNALGLVIPMIGFDHNEKHHFIGLEMHASDEGKLLLWLHSKDQQSNTKLLAMQQERNESMILLEKIRQQEKALLDYNQRLTVAHQGLERFAFIVSHDLKSPLRAIGNLAEWIVEAVATNNKAELEEFLPLLRKRVNRAERLLDGILEYCNAGNDHRPAELLSLSEMVSRVSQTVFHAYEISLNLPKFFPELVANRNLLQLILFHLFSNVKLHAATSTPSLQLTCSSFDGYVEFAIIDNGPGISPQNQAHIFEIFHTLHSKDDMETTGIGLAIVKKIVESMGGKIWINSEVGKGAAFHFTIPQALNAN